MKLEVTSEQMRVVGALREHVRASVAYCEQDSRSERRRKAMLDDAKTVLDDAEKEFGPE